MGIRLFNSRGNTTMMALFVVGVVSTGVYFISNKIIVERKLTAQLRKDIHANLALRSITDYIKYGIRKGWCFDDKLLPEKPETCVDNFTNPTSTMRLMMPPSYAQTLETLGRDHATDFPNLAGKKAEDLMLRKITRKLDLSSFAISEAHPLFRVIANVRSHLVKGLNVTISRAGNMTLPVNGDEVYLDITTEFTGADGKTLRTGLEVQTDDGEGKATGNQFFRETARFVSNPREINSFVLMLPGTIYVGDSSPPEPNHGDLAIPKGSTTNKGMVFNSPVFVNENIVLNQTGYSPVTFNDVVVLGNGIIKTPNGDPFKINEALGEKRYWTDLKTFGGFIRGIDSDGKRDPGLSTLNGVSDSTTLNNDIISQCINIIRSQSDPDMTSTSRLVSEPVGGVAPEDDLSETTLRFSFSEISTGALNLFVPQVIASSDGGIKWSDGKKTNGLDLPFNASSKTKSNISYSISPTYSSASGTKLVMWAYMEADSDYDSSTKNDKLMIPILENSAGDGYTAAVSFTAYTKEELDTAFAQFQTASQTLTTRTNKLSTLELSKPASGASLTAWTSTNGTEYTNLKDSKTVSGSVEFYKEQTKEFQEEYEQRKKYYETAGIIEITSTKPNNSFKERQSVFRNVTIKILNGSFFRKQKDSSVKIHGTNIYKTTLAPLDIDNFSIEGMDYSAIKGGISTRARDSKKNVTNDPSVNPVADINNVHFNFKIDNSDPDKPLVFSNKAYDYNDKLIDLGKYKPLDYKVNYQAKINKCFDSAGGTNLDAFKPASFASADFTKVAADSWHFASPDPKTTYYNEDIVSNSFDFKIAATRDTCTVHSNVNIVTGFFVCRNLVILARSNPLEMIGTFIVTKNMTVDQSALSAGVTWSSIHNQAAVATLKEANASGQPTLRRAGGGNCSGLYNPSVPFWHPDPGLNILADRIRCSSTFLLQGKGPPRWTSVDPDCGRIGDSTNTKCLKRIRNYNLIQLERVYGD